jgi:hypothetical protein
MSPRRVFTVAGIYGIAALLPQYFLAQRIGEQTPPPITHLEFFYGFLGVALAWQVAFLIIARDPVRFRPLMLPSILEKLSFGVATVVLFAQGRLAALMLGAGLLDLVFAGLFAVAYVRTAAAR